MYHIFLHVTEIDLDVGVREGDADAASEAHLKQVSRVFLLESL